MASDRAPKQRRPSALIPSEEVFRASAVASASVNRWQRQGLVRRLARGLYTANTADTLAVIARRNVFRIAGLLFPGAVMSGRSFVAGGLTTDDELTLVWDREARGQVQGIRFRVLRGAQHLPDDLEWLGSGIYLASPARGLLENARLTRGRGDRRSPTLSRPELEEYLDRRLQLGGPDALNRLREQCRAVASALDAVSEFDTVNRIIGALLGTHDVAGRSEVLRARQAGSPFDAGRLERFDTLAKTLGGMALADIPASPGDARERYLPFFEAYFSNFIEGTEFEVDEAIAIVYDGHVPSARPADAHDVLGTYRLVSDSVEMSLRPADPREFLDIIRRRHAALMEYRPDVHPGEFKSRSNRAGGTVFVEPDRVAGTLIRGFDRLTTLNHPLARAVYMMFLVTEVHPFTDGNGRVGRVMMNAELVSQRQERILVTPIDRDSYIGVLRNMGGLGTTADATRLADVLAADQRATHSIDYGDLEGAKRQLDSLLNAFAEPADNRLTF